MEEIYSSLAGKVLRKEFLLFFKFPLTKVMESKSLFYLFIFLQAYIFGLFELKNYSYLSVTILVKKPIERLRNISPLPFRKNIFLSKTSTCLFVLCIWKAMDYAKTTK